MGRFELDDSDDELSVCLPPDLENFIRKYMKKYDGDNTAHNPAQRTTQRQEMQLASAPPPPPPPHSPLLDIYINELVKETVTGNRTLRVNRFLTNIQEAIRNVLGPVTQLWVSAANQRDELLAVEVTEGKASLHSVVSLVGHTSQRTSYYKTLKKPKRC